MESSPINVWMEPSRLTLAPAAPRRAHHVGEWTVFRRAAAELEVTVFAEDAVSHRPIDGEVRIGAACAATNRPFRHRFEAEFDERRGVWVAPPIVVECPERGSAEVQMDLEVAESPDGEFSD